MTDQPLPDHETLERVIFTQPSEVIKRLPDNTERRRAEELLDIVYGYAKEAREKKEDRHA